MNSKSPNNKQLFGDLEFITSVKDVMVNTASELNRSLDLHL